MRSEQAASGAASSCSLLQLSFWCACTRHAQLSPPPPPPPRRPWPLQGGIDYFPHYKENPMDAARRELKEETGITNCRIVASVRGRRAGAQGGSQGRGSLEPQRGGAQSCCG